MERELLALNDLDADKEKAVLSLREYLSKNKVRLRYAERLAANSAPLVETATEVAGLK